MQELNGYSTFRRYVRIEHSMTKEHYISFVAAASSDGIQMVKLYPEQNAGAKGIGTGRKNAYQIGIG